MHPNTIAKQLCYAAYFDPSQTRFKFVSFVLDV